MSWPARHPWLAILLGVVLGMFVAAFGGVIVIRAYAGDVLVWWRALTYRKPGLLGGPGTPPGAESLTG